MSFKWMVSCLYFLGTLFQIGNASFVKSQTWENLNMQYTILHNTYTPVFNPPVSVKQLVDKAINEYSLPGITINIIYDSTLFMSFEPQHDGLNTISFHPNYSTASTTFYTKAVIQALEFDMRFKAYMYINPETLYASILHEFGHVFGLKHPDDNSEAIMSHPVIIKPNGEYVKEHVYLRPTKEDILSLYLNEIIFRAPTKRRKTKLDNTLKSIIDDYPDTIREQYSQPCLFPFSIDDVYDDY
jgi:hypothetical protein